MCSVRFADGLPVTWFYLSISLSRIVVSSYLLSPINIPIAHRPSPISHLPPTIISSSSNHHPLKPPSTPTSTHSNQMHLQLSKKAHPDVPGGNRATFEKLSEAYSVLGDDSKRQVESSSLRSFSSPSFFLFSFFPGFCALATLFFTMWILDGLCGC